MTNQEAMKLALEAMRGLYGGWRCETAIKACEEALAKQEQGEPVAWMKEQWSPDCGPYVEIYRDDEMGWRDPTDWTPLYTTPQQRTWVGLTDEELRQIWYDDAPVEGGTYVDKLRQVEAKLKEKNT